MLRRLARDRRGIAATEFALVAPIFAMLMVGMVNFSMGFNRKLELEQSANRAIEKVMQTTMTDTVAATLAKEASDAAKVPIENVTVKYWLECNGVEQAQYDSVCPSGQRYSRYLSVKLFDKFHPVMTGMYLGPNADGSYTLWGDAGIRTQ